MNTVCASCQALNRIPQERMQDAAKCGRCGHELFDGDVINATGETLDKLLKDDLPVVVDFWAPWCGPCRMLSPTISEIAEEYKDKVKVCKVNVDEEGDLAAMFRVSSIPLLVVMKDGKVTNSAVGVRPKDQIVKMI